MFIAMMAILSCHLAQAFPLPDSVLWAYVPDPPFLRPVTWNDPAFPVYINDTSILGFPSSSHITPKLLPTLTLPRLLPLPMCFYASKIWDHDFSANVYSPPSIPLSFSGPYCFDLEFADFIRFLGPRPLPRETYNFSSAQRFPLIEHHHCGPSNSSLDPSPHWQFCFPAKSKLLIIPYLLVSPYLTARYETPGGWSTPVYTTFSGKAYTSLEAVYILISYVCSSGSRSVSYPTRHTIYTQSCVASPYAIIAGNVSLPELLARIPFYCENCILTNCIDSSLFPAHTLLLVHQPPMLCYPLMFLDRGMMKRPFLFSNKFGSYDPPKRFLATAATAAVSLAHSVQTATYVNHLAKNISVMMGTQMDINKKMDEKLNALEQTVTILGDKLYNIQNPWPLAMLIINLSVLLILLIMTLNGSGPRPFTRDLTHDNLSLDVFKLQQEIHAIDFSLETCLRMTQLPVILWTPCLPGYVEFISVLFLF
ncbi:LOW QUALITY PROTEIN: Endogenous retrovirus group K member 25 Env polyprotein [Plecturocebus cupreus]